MSFSASQLVPGLGRAVRQRRVVFFVWLFRALAAWVIAAPVAALLSGQGVARFPEGDALLFAPGAMHLVEALRLSLPELGSTLRISIMSAGVFGFLSLVPLAGLCSSLAVDSPTRIGWAIARGLDRLSSFALLGGITLFVQGVVAVLGAIVTGLVERRLALGHWTERSQDLAVLATIALCALFLVGIGVLQDVARSALATQDVSTWRALRLALRTTRRRPLEIAIAWSISAVWSVVLIAVVSIAVQRLDVSRPSALGFLAIVLLHQVVAFVLVVLRATWLGRSFEVVDEITTRG